MSRYLILAAALSFAVTAHATDYSPTLELRFNEPGLPRVWSGHGFGFSQGPMPTPSYFIGNSTPYWGGGWWGRAATGGGHHHGRGGRRR